jgi:tetratricopeptide (TPR) repeat protein
MNKLQQALSYLEKALAIQPYGIDQATTHNNIGGVYSHLDQHDKAIEHYRHALDIFTNCLHSNHSDVARVCTNLSTVYNAIDDTEQALEFAQRAHTIFCATLPQHHPDLAISHNNVAMLLAQQGCFRRALDHNRMAMHIAWKQKQSRVIIACQFNRQMILNEYAL